VDGKRVATYQLSGTTWTLVYSNTWFMGRLLKPQDRLNSVGKYFPYGEDRYNPTPANPANGVEKFATYTRDAETVLDYAYQRYYTSGLVRFLTVDPKSASRLARPSSELGPICLRWQRPGEQQRSKWEGVHLRWGSKRLEPAQHQ
jgi:RHS repeat-associated protein